MKKNLCLFITAVLIFTAFPIIANAFPSDLDNVPYEEIRSEDSTVGDFSDRNILRAYRLMKYIGVITEDESEFDHNEVVKKDYAANAAVLLKNDYIPKSDEQPFTDVPKDYEYADGIAAAYTMGIVESNNGRFYPNKNLSWDELAYMGIVLLNRHYMMGNLTLRVYANQLDIFDGVDTMKENVTKGDLIKVFENILNADYVDLNGVNTNGEPQLTVITDRSLLNAEKNIYLNDGVVTAHRFTSVNGDKDLQEGKIEINKAEFTVGIPVDNSLVGLYCNFYVDKEKGKNLIIDLWEDERRTVKFEIDETKLMAYDKTSVTYNSNGKPSIKSVQKQTPVIYNGVYYGSYESAVSNKILDGCSKVVLISNNGNNAYDVVRIEKYTYYVVKAVSASSGNVAFKYNKGSISTLSNKVNASFSLRGEIVDLTGVKANDVLSVKEALTLSNNRVFIAEICRDMISGKITEIASDKKGDYYVINEEKHYLTAEYKDYLKNDNTEEKPQMGKSAVFYLAVDGKIVTSAAESGWQYGYMMASAEFGGAFDKTYAIRVYQTGGTVGEYNFDDKVTYYNDLNLTGTRDEAVTAYGVISGYTGAIAYKLNGDSLITEIAKPIDRTGYAHNTIDYPLTLDRGVEETKGARQYRDVLSNRYNLINIPIIVHPTDASLVNDEDVYSVRGVRYWTTEHYFTEAENLELYNIDEYGIADFASMYGNQTTTNVDREEHIYMVADTYMGLNDNGDPVRIVEYYSGSSLVKRVIADDAEIIEQGSWLNAPTTVANIKKGDIIQITLDAKSEINAMRVVFSTATPPSTYCVQTVSTTDGVSTSTVTYDATTAFSSFRVLYGKINDIRGSQVLINCSATGLDATLTGPVTIGHSAYGSVFYVLYDTVSDTVKNCTISEIMPDDTVVMRKYYNHVLDVFIIR